MMIQIYAPKNTNFDMNGDEVLTPSLCTMESELGGAWSLNMTHPIDDEGKWKNIVKEAVISTPTFMGKKQLFRIEESDKQDTEIVVKAYPIFFDSADEVFLMDKRPTDKNGQEAIDILTEDTKYSGESNITSVNTAYFIRRNLMNAINGDSPSFIDIWGGEPLYDNFRVIINERAGGDYGAEVRYGKNMDGVSFKEDMSEVVTRIVPVAFNGRTFSGSYVDSPLINKYAKVYTREIVFEDVKYYEDIMTSEDTSNLIICNSQEELDAALIVKCNEQFEAGIDVYKVTIGVDMVSLENTEEYKDFTDLVRIGLGDTVGCYNKRLGITTKARAIKIKWNCITDSVEKVVIGDYEYNILDQWNSTISKIENIVNDDGTVAAEKIQGILNAINVQLHYQKSAAHKQEVRAILFEDLDPESPLYGALAIGTQGLQISNTRTDDGRDWEWTTAFTANGGYADAIVAGILADKTGKNSWNLNTGELIIGKGTKLDGKSVDDIIEAATKAEQAIISVRVEYALGNSTGTAPNDGWSDEAPQWEDGKYMWQRTTTEYVDGTTETTSPTCISGATGQPGADGSPGTNGEDGADGVGVSSIQQYYLATANSSGVTTSTAGWTTGVQAITATKKYLWNYEEITYTDKTKTKTTPCIIGAYGDTGAQGEQGEKGDTGEKGATGADGKDGADGTRGTGTYKVTTEPSSYTTATGGFTPTYRIALSTVKTQSKATEILVGDILEYSYYHYPVGYVDRSYVYLGSRTSIRGETGATGAQGEQGDKGDTGNGISSIAEKYAVSTSNTTVPTAWSDTVPTMTATKKYLWNYEIITYTNGNEVETTKRVIGVYGDKGTTGAAGADGKDGVGITSIIEQYYLSSSNSAQAGGAWSATCPAWESGYYIWTRSYITWTDGTTSTTTPVLANGINTANTNATDAVNKASLRYGTCETAAATATKVVSLPGFSLYKGAMVSVSFTYANTATNPKLNVNGTGGKAIHVNGANITNKFYWRAKNTVSFIYDGTYWVMSDTCANTILADWCDENDVTLINGGKLATHSVTANKILVDDLIAFEATIGGWEITKDGLTKIGMAFILPTEEDYEMIKNASLGTVILTDKQKKAADINGDGIINISEIVAWKSILLGKHSLDDFPNYTPVKSDIYIEINPNDADKTIRLFGTNSFGTEVESYYGINLLRTQSVKAAAGRFGKLQAGEIRTDAGADLDELNSNMLKASQEITRDISITSSARLYTFSNYITGFTEIVGVVLASHGVSNSYDNKLHLADWSVSGETITISVYGDVDTYPNCRFIILYK